jgi:hypothetical protein
MKFTAIVALSFLPLLAQSAPNVGAEELASRSTNPLCSITARVDCQPTAHTGSNPRYRLYAGDYVSVTRHAAGEKVQHNGKINGYVPPFPSYWTRWALINYFPVTGSS